MYIGFYIQEKKNLYLLLMGKVTQGRDLPYITQKK